MKIEITRTTTHRTKFDFCSVKGTLTLTDSQCTALKLKQWVYDRLSLLADAVADVISEEESNDAAMLLKHERGVIRNLVGSDVDDNTAIAELYFSHHSLPGTVMMLTAKISCDLVGYIRSHADDFEWQERFQNAYVQWEIEPTIIAIPIDHVRNGLGRTPAGQTDPTIEHTVAVDGDDPHEWVTLDKVKPGYYWVRYEGSESEPEMDRFQMGRHPRASEDELMCGWVSPLPASDYYYGSKVHFRKAK